jgi:protein-disulfide isomerase
MPRRTRPQKSRSKSTANNKRLWLIGIIALVAIAAAVVIILLGNTAPRYTGVPNPDRNTMGDPQAPVLIEEYSDFQCPYCALFFRETEPELVEKYIATGKARLTYIPFSFLGSESLSAAEAAYCAADQNKFWNYHFILFSSQAAENSGVYAENNLMRYAAEAGLDMPQFRQCYNAGTHAQLVKENLAQGMERGVTSTPSFYVNGKGPFNVNALIAEVEKAVAGE